MLQLEISNFFFLYILLLPVLSDSTVALNNVCRTWSGYWNEAKDSDPNCFFNPVMYMDVPELLTKYFGGYETHEIPTQDGYFVTTFRIPRKNAKGTILLRHPAISDSISWVGQGNESIAYYFWKRGYEIWLTNTRGTDFSTKHVNLTTDDYAFWNFSFHEIAVYDLRASLKYINEKIQKRKVIVIAHSMGSTESLIYTSLFPKEAEKYAKVFILLGPSYRFKYSTIKMMGRLIPIFQKNTRMEQIGSLFGRRSAITRTINSICPKRPDFCISLYSFLGAGWSTVEPDPVAAAILFAQNPKPLSVKSVIHYGQIMLSGKFRMYDYGVDNFKMYGSFQPSDYPVSKITVPIVLVISSEDNLATMKDTEDLYQQLSASAKIYGKLEVTGMNHVDALIGKQRNVELYDRIIELLNKL